MRQTGCLFCIFGVLVMACDYTLYGAACLFAGAVSFAVGSLEWPASDDAEEARCDQCGQQRRCRLLPSPRDRGERGAKSYWCRECWDSVDMER